MTLLIKSPLSGEVQALLTNPSKTLDIDQFDTCIAELRKLHQKKMIRSFIIMLVLFALGLTAVEAGMIFWAVLLLIVADNSNRKSSHHMLADELLVYQGILAMLINQHTNLARPGAPREEQV